MSERLSAAFRSSLREGKTPAVMLWLNTLKGTRVFSADPLPADIFAAQAGTKFNAAVMFDASVMFNGGSLFLAAERRALKVGALKAGTASMPENLVGSFRRSSRRSLRVVLANDDRAITKLFAKEPLLMAGCQVKVGFIGLALTDYATVLEGRVERVEIRGSFEAALTVKEV